MVQMASGVAQLDGRKAIERVDMDWVIESGHYPERPEQAAAQENRVGAIHGLAVQGAHQGAVMEIEAVAGPGSGRVRVTGIVEEEELGGSGHTMRRKSTAHASAENVMTLLRRLGYADERTDLHINFPGGAPVDGPSAGVAMTVVAVSALTNRPVDGACAVTGEISVQGLVRPVGGVAAKVDAARQAGLTRVLVPRENYLERFDQAGIQVVPIDTIGQAIDLLLLPAGLQERGEPTTLSQLPLTAARG